MGHPESLTSTTYYTAFTSVEPSSTVLSQVSQISSVKTTSHIGLSEEDEFEDTVSEGDRGSFSATLREELVVEEIAHLPPHRDPGERQYQGFGRSLRDSVVWRQQSRVFLPSDHLLATMEDLLVRWTLPLSVFRMDDVSNGRHAFQRPNIPKLDLLGSPVSRTLTTTDSKVESSIIRAPMLQNTPAVMRQSPLALLFQEHLPQLDTILETCSIRDNPDFKPSDSASVNSSIMLKLKSTSPSREPQTLLASQVSPMTIDAEPINDRDIETLIKDQPTEQADMTAQRQLLERLREVNRVHGDGELIGQLISDLWNDFLMCLSCHCDFDDLDDTARGFYLQQQQPT